MDTCDERGRVRPDPGACVRLRRRKKSYDYERLKQLADDIPIYYRSWEPLALGNSESKGTGLLLSVRLAVADTVAPCDNSCAQQSAAPEQRRQREGERAGSLLVRFVVRGASHSPGAALPIEAGAPASVPNAVVDKCPP